MVDGFSRKVLWYEVATTNNKPQVITHFYLKAINKFGYVPTSIRSNNRTENNIIENLQQAFRLDHEDHFLIEPFLRDKSTANQRVESSWARMRHLCIEFWINFFKDMRDCKHFNKSNKIQVECLRFCFGPLISFDLNQIKSE